MGKLRFLLLISFFKYVGSMRDLSTYVLSTVAVVSYINHVSATSDEDSFATVAPQDISYKRTTVLPVIATTKTHQGDELDTEIEVASGDYMRASQFYIPIRPSVPVQISASDSIQIEHDIRPSRSSTGVVEQQTTVMSQGSAYVGANQESLLKTVPHLNISTSLYQTSGSIQPLVFVLSLERPIRPTPSFGYAHSSSITIAPAAHTERLESFTLSIFTTTLEVSPTASLRQLQTAQNWRMTQPSQSHLLSMPTDDLSTLIWSYSDLNMPQTMATTSVQPSPSELYITSASLVQTTERSLSQLSKNVSPDLVAAKSDMLDTTETQTHAQFSENVTPSLSTSPDLLKLTTPDLPQTSTDNYQTQTSGYMAPSETGQISDDDPALRPAITPSPSIVMESATSNWNWSHRIPINANNATINKEGLSTPNKLLVVSVMVVIGCFALTALALRIGNRIIKLRKKGNKKSCCGYLRSLCPKRNTQQRPKPMSVTVRMTRQTSKKNNVKSTSSRQDSVKTITSVTSVTSGVTPTSILRHSKSLAALHDYSTKPNALSEQSTNSFVKRSRTMDALLDIGAISPNFPELAGPENLLESSSEATLLCRDMNNKRTRFCEEVYDNPLMKVSVDESTAESTASYGSQTELQLFMDYEDSKVGISSDCLASLDRTSNDSPICIITPLKTDFDMPQQSPINSDKSSMEHSETESQNDTKRKFQFNKCLNWSALQQSCSSKDSGYGDTTSPCQDVDMLPLQDFNIVDEVSTENDTLINNRELLKKRRSSFDTPTTGSPSSCYPLSSIEESPPPKSRCERCDSLYIQSDDSYYSQEKTPQSVSWTHNISGLLRDTLANYLNSDDRRYDDYNANTSHGNTGLDYQYPEYNCVIPQYDINRNDPPSPSVVKKFFKKRSSTISTQTGGPPLQKRPSVKWHNESGTYMIKPREDAGMEFMGPIYLAKSLEDFGPFVSGRVIDRDMDQSAV